MKRQSYAIVVKRDRRPRIHQVVRGTYSNHKVLCVFTNKKKAIQECIHRSRYIEGVSGKGGDWGPYFIISRIKKELRTVREK